MHGNVPTDTIDENTTSDSFAANTDSFAASPPEPFGSEQESVSQLIDTPQENTNTTLPQNIAAPKKKIPRLNNAAMFKKLVTLEEQKVEMFKERNSVSKIEDADYHFLMSLLPYMRKIPEERKMYVRTKLQQVFCDEEFSSSRGEHLTVHGKNNRT